MGDLVRTKVNLILAGVWTRAGALIESERIPDHLLLDEYVEWNPETDEPLASVKAKGPPQVGESPKRSRSQRRAISSKVAATGALEYAKAG